MRPRSTHQSPSPDPESFVTTYSRCVLLAAVLLAACGTEQSASADRAAAGDSAGAVDTAAAAGSADADSTSGAARLVLAPDGVEVAGGSAGERLPFGTPQARVLAAAGSVLGAPKEQGPQEECPAGPVHYAGYDGLQLIFQEGAFVGWSAREGSTLRTAAGIGPGSTLGEVKAAYPSTTVEQSTLGTEFAAGEISGVVDGPTDAARVEVLWAGITCVFR
jgi:hypothetical protein